MVRNLHELSFLSHRSRCERPRTHWTCTFVCLVGVTAGSDGFCWMRWSWERRYSAIDRRDGERSLSRGNRFVVHYQWCKMASRWTIVSCQTFTEPCPEDEGENLVIISRIARPIAEGVRYQENLITLILKSSILHLIWSWS